MYSCSQARNPLSGMVWSVCDGRSCLGLVLPPNLAIFFRRFAKEALLGRSFNSKCVKSSSIHSIGDLVSSLRHLRSSTAAPRHAEIPRLRSVRCHSSFIDMIKQNALLQQCNCAPVICLSPSATLQPSALSTLSFYSVESSHAGN
jgi:hypothetical protein